MAMVLKRRRIHNPGRKRRRKLSVLQKLFFGSKRQRSAAAKGLKRRKNARRKNFLLTGKSTFKPTKHVTKTGKVRKGWFIDSSGSFKRKKRRRNISGIITAGLNPGRKRRTYKRRANPRRRTRRNIEAGKWTSKGFIPFRSSWDYDPDRAGDDYGSSSDNRGAGKYRKNPGRKKKGVRRYPGMARRRKNSRRTYRRRSLRANPFRRRRVYRRRNRAVMAYRPRRRRHNRSYRRHYRRNPGVVSGLPSLVKTSLWGIVGLVGSKLAAQTFLSAYNTGFVGYAANIVAGTALGYGVSKVTKSREAFHGIMLGTVIGVVARALSDYGITTVFGQNISLTGLGDLAAIGPSTFFVPLSTNGYGMQPQLPGAVTSIAAAATARAAGMKGLGSASGRFARGGGRF